MADRFGYGEIGLDTNPCRGREDYDAPDGCKCNGGCGKPTNADRIRAMSDEELALFIEKCTKGFIEPTGCGDNCLREDCYDCWLDWLKQEAEK